MEDNKIKAIVIKADKPNLASGQIPDPFEGLYETEGLLEPPYDPLTFARLPEMNNILTPLIDAYKTNIAGFGYSFRYKIDMESPDIDASIKDRAKKEWIALENFYQNCNFDKSFTKIVQDMIDDRERIGYGFIEVIPKGDNLPGGLEYVPAHTIRISKLHPDIQMIPVAAVGIDGKKITITYARRFRRFCQIRENEKIWFKEFGDPRKMDKNTGRFEVELGPNGEEIKTEVLPENEATSLIYFPIHCPYTPYGVPRWIGNILSIYGSRSSEELNYNYFRRGKHIPMAILVKNGTLTQSSIDELKSYATNLEGTENAHGYLILEAESFDNQEDVFEESGRGPVDIKLQPLTQVIQHDALFQDYDKNNRNKIRSAFRLPPIYTGDSEDYTRATADTARAIAEEQIFNPEREEIANKFNRLINTAFGIRYVEMYLKGPNLTNKLELAQAVNVYWKAGALTPNMLIGAVSELLGQEFEPIQEEWGNKPINLTIAELERGVKVPEAKGNKTAPKASGQASDAKSTGSKPSFTDNSAEEPIKG